MTTQMIHPSSEALSAYAMQTGVVGPYTILSITQVDDCLAPVPPRS